MEGIIECIIRLKHSEAEEIEINLVKFNVELGVTFDVNDVEQMVWELELLQFSQYQADDEAKTISKASIRVSGREAVERLIEQPIIAENGNIEPGTRYVYRVMFANGEDVYHYYMRTTVQAEFEQYRAVTEQILARLVIKK